MGIKTVTKLQTPFEAYKIRAKPCNSFCKKILQKNKEP